MLTAISLCLAAIIVSGAHVGRQFGLVGDSFMRSISFTAAGSSQPAKPDSAALKAGVAQPSPPPVLPSPSPSQDVGLSPSPLDLLSPSPTIISRPALQGGSSVPILMYHYIRYSPDRAGVGLSVLPPDFEAQMHYLKEHGYHTITMRELDQALIGQGQLPSKPVALTFDDGYKDFYTTAVPVMQSLGITATNYVPTMLVDRSNYMTWSQIEELDRLGFEMAAHSQFHVDVSKVSASRAEIEIFGAKSDLENHLGHEVVDWAYPFGGYNYTTIQLVQRAGYWSGVTARGGSWHDAPQLPLLSRVRVQGGESLSAFAASLNSN